MGSSFIWEEEVNEQVPVPSKVKRNVRSHKIEFVGWGSKPLIEFLESIGKSSSEQLSQREMTNIVNDYVRANKLLHPEKKKRVLCDERLYNLFGKNSVPQNRIHDLLEAHFAENHDSSDDELLYSSEEEGDGSLSSKRRKISSSEKKTTSQKKQASATRKSCFASIIPENMKLLHLKRTLIMDLLKIPESFEIKLVGSYVRVKSDPNDIFQKHSHQLLPVTGVRNVPENGDLGKEVLLQIPTMLGDIPIHRVSDGDFKEEECEDLRQKIKEGLLKRPTVGEFEQQAHILREDIIKHWLPREIVYLQNLIDRANEKGWRRELFEYLEKKQLLQKPSEELRLISEVPNVIPDELELEANQQDPLQNLEHGEFRSPTSTLRNGSLDSGAVMSLSSSSSDVAGYRDISIPSEDPPSVTPVVGDSIIGFTKEITVDEANGDTDVGKHLQVDLNEAPIGGDRDAWFSNSIRNVNELNVQQPDAPELSRAPCEPVLHGTEEKKVAVIELSDDDDDEVQKVDRQNSVSPPVDPIRTPLWHYFDPQGSVQGPFSMESLARWHGLGYFAPSFKVWRVGQTAADAVLLSDVLRQNIPHWNL